MREYSQTGTSYEVLPAVSSCTYGMPVTELITPAYQYAKPGETITYVWKVTSTNSAGCGPVAFNSRFNQILSPGVYGPSLPLSPGAEFYLNSKESKILSANVTIPSDAAIGSTLSFDHSFQTSRMTVGFGITAKVTSTPPSPRPDPFTTDFFAPAPPILFGTLVSTTATLSWTRPKDNYGVVSYEIWKNAALLKKVAAKTSPETFIDSRVRGKSYYFIVAVDAAGNRSEPSNLVTFNGW